MNDYIKLGDLISSISKTHSFDKEKLVFLNTSDVSEGKILINHYSEVATLKGQAKKAIQNGDILYSEIRPKNKRYAYVKNLQNPEDYVVSTKLMVLRKNSKDIDTDYLYHFLTSESTLKYLQRKAENRIGSFPQITFDVLKIVKIRLPILSDQQKIAAVLSALDDKIELNNQINAELEAMAKTLYDYWFVQFDFPFDSAPFDSAQGPESQNSPVAAEHAPVADEHESVAERSRTVAERSHTVAERSRTVAERSRGYKSSGGKMVYNEVLKREIPEGWGFMTIGNLGNVVGGSTPSKGDDSNFCTNGTSWITPKDLSINSGNKFITRGELDVSEKGLKEAPLNILPKNSVLMSSRAPVGYLAINRKACTTNQGFKSIVCDKGFPAEYVFYVLQHHMKTIEANATGSTFKEISGTVFKSINIIKPQQKEIVQFVEKVRPIFERQNNLELQNQELAQLRDWLLPMLMNGQVTVGDVEEMGMVAEEKMAYSNNLNK